MIGPQGWALGKGHGQSSEAPRGGEDEGEDLGAEQPAGRGGPGSWECRVPIRGLSARCGQVQRGGQWGEGAEGGERLGHTREVRTASGPAVLGPRGCAGLCHHSHRPRSRLTLSAILAVVRAGMCGRHLGWETCPATWTVTSASHRPAPLRAACSDCPVMMSHHTQVPTFSPCGRALCPALRREGRPGSSQCLCLTLSSGRPCSPSTCVPTPGHCVPRHLPGGLLLLAAALGLACSCEGCGRTGLRGWSGPVRWGAGRGQHGPLFRGCCAQNPMDSSSSAT